MTNAEVESKFRDCAAGVVDDTAQERIVDFVRQLEEAPSIDQLVDAMHPPRTGA